MRFHAVRRRSLALGFAHWLAAIALLTRAASAAPAEPITVAVDLRAFDRAAFHAVGGLELEKRVLVRLVQDGFAIVARDAHPDLAIVIRPAGTDVVLEETANGLAVTVAGAGLTLDELHLAVAQDAAELARRARQALLLQPDRGPPAGAVFAGAAACFRSPSFDLRAELGAGLHVRRWFPHVVVGVMPSGAPRLHVLELEGQLGLGWETRLSQHWLLQLAPRAGVRVHHFAADTGSDGGSGTQLDLLATVDAEARWELTRQLSLAIELAAGATSATYRHVLDGELIWSRSPWRAQAGARVEWRR